RSAPVLRSGHQLESRTAFPRPQADGLVLRSYPGPSVALPCLIEVGRKSCACRDFDEQMEILRFQGNVSARDGEPMLHIPGVFARRDFSVVCGHMKDACVHPRSSSGCASRTSPCAASTTPGIGSDLVAHPHAAPAE